MRRSCTCYFCADPKCPTSMTERPRRNGYQFRVTLGAGGAVGRPRMTVRCRSGRWDFEDRPDGQQVGVVTEDLAVELEDLFLAGRFIKILCGDPVERVAVGDAVCS